MWLASPVTLPHDPDYACCAHGGEDGAGPLGEEWEAVGPGAPCR